MPALIELLIFFFGIGLAGATVWVNLTPEQKKNLISKVTNVVLAGLHGAIDLLNDAEPLIDPIVKAFVAGIKKWGPTINQDVRIPIEALVKATLAEKQAALETLGASTPENFAAVAGAAMADAFGFGIGSFGVTAAFEAAFPEKLNVLNGTGPIIASMAGFDEVTKAVLEPLYKNAFGQSAEYHFRSVFKPDFPTEGDAIRWHSRRLIDDATLRKIFGVSGLKPEYEEPFVQSAYRAMSPFMLAAGFLDQDIDEPLLRDVFQFMGLRDKDINIAIKAVENRSLQSVRQGYVNEATTAYGQGVVSDDELQQVLDDAGWGTTAKHYATKRALLARRITLAREAEAYIVPEVAQGLLTPDEGLQAIEAAGVQPWQAQLKITLAETRAALTAARKAAAAERKLELQRQRNLTRAAVAEYERGTLDDVGLTAALSALGLDLTLVTSIVAVESAKRAGRLKLVFGQLLDPSAAKVLTDSVAALETQFKKQLIDEPSVRAQLAGLKIEAPEIEAMVARWAAARTAPTKTGYVLPV